MDNENCKATVRELTITIPEKQWRKIWNKNFPDTELMLIDYFFILHTTYGVKLEATQALRDEINEARIHGELVFLRCPKGWEF